jgi:hypothetical protein
MPRFAARLAARMIPIQKLNASMKPYENILSGPISISMGCTQPS